jgi:hypothetical protein
MSEGERPAFLTLAISKTIRPFPFKKRNKIKLLILKSLKLDQQLQCLIHRSSNIAVQYASEYHDATQNAEQVSQDYILGF